MSPLLARIVAAGVQGIALAVLDAAERVAVERLLKRGSVEVVERRQGREVARVVRAPGSPEAEEKPKKKPADPLERYYTPAALARWAVAIVAGVLHDAPPARILEPSVGAGVWIGPLRAAWPEAVIAGVDLDPEAAGLALCDEAHVADILTVSGERPDLAIGNPPFSLARAHLEHLYQLVRPGGVVALLLPATIGHLAGWAGAPIPAQEHPLLGRPRFEGPGAGGSQGRTEYSLFVWRTGQQHILTLKYPPSRWKGLHREAA